VKVVVHDDGHVLLLHRRPERGNFWQPITGSIEEGETPLETARRELVEETGHGGEPLDMDLRQSFMIESQFLQSRYTTPIIASEIGFRASLDSRLPIKIDPLEHDDHGWFTFAEAYERIRWTDDREALEQLQARLTPISV
jgi:lipoyl(octanoyl) transferase